MFQNLVILTEKLVIGNWCINDNSFHEKLDMNNVYHIFIFLFASCILDAGSNKPHNCIPHIFKFVHF